MEDCATSRAALPPALPFFIAFFLSIFSFFPAGRSTGSPNDGLISPAWMKPGKLRLSFGWCA